MHLGGKGRGADRRLVAPPVRGSANPHVSLATGPSCRTCAHQALFRAPIVSQLGVDCRDPATANWRKRLLKADLARADLSYEAPAAKLGETGLQEMKASIASKLSRGTFSASFLLASLKAAGCVSIRLEDV